MIKILVLNARHAPIIMCDLCGQKIDDAIIGAAIFNNRTPGGDRLPDGSVIDVLHAHKGECHDLAETKLGGKELTGWIELERHVRYVLHNSGLDLQELLDYDDFDNEVGTL